MGDVVSQLEFEAVTRLSRVRGMLVGLGYGDAVARSYHGHGNLANSAVGQLTCFTTEALIGALLRRKLNPLRVLERYGGGTFVGPEPAVLLLRRHFMRARRLVGTGRGGG